MHEREYDDDYDHRKDQDAEQEHGPVEHFLAGELHCVVTSYGNVF